MVQAILAQRRQTNEQVFEILFNSDDVTWKQIIFGLIDQEEMDPWDIDITLIAQKFMEMLKSLKQMDFRITGKIVLASAILLKMKSNRLMDEDIAALDHLINSADEPVDLGLFEELPMDGALLEQKGDKPRLVPRTPQPRKRKVSVYDLVEALEKALEVEARRVKPAPQQITVAEAPKGHTDLSVIMQDVYDRINKHYKKRNAPKMSFTDLCPSEEKDDKVFTFIPLLHLDFQRKVDILQQEHFSTIHVSLLEPDAVLETVDES